MLICFPSTPPAALASSTARMVPSWELWPNVAVGPVIEAYSPMSTVFDDEPEPVRLHPPPPIKAVAIRRRGMRRGITDLLGWKWGTGRAGGADARPAIRGEM